MQLERAKLEKMARMVLFDVPEEQIARAVGMPEITDALESKEFKDILSSVSTEYFEHNQQLNDGWNSIEALALGTIVENLTWSRDPDFALRAAAVANKAHRRGDVSQQPINGQAGARAVINLTANFIDKLQQFNMGTEKSAVNGNGSDAVVVNNEPPHKDTDYMVPEKVEKLFVTKQPKVRKPEDFLNFFPEVDLVPAE